MFPSVNEQMDIIRDGAIEVLPEDELVRKIENSIKNNKPLNIKLGADPSRPDLHIGHAVVLHKLRQFQDLGHKAILIIGDFTAMIGDPTGKSKTRPQLTLEETRINGQSYLEQATIILKKENLEVVYNSDWLGKMSFSDVIQLAARYTVAQLLERDDFSKRFKSGIPISVHELLYPLAQAMDSAQIKADVELGGTDQKFNLIVGREIQKAYGLEPQCIVTMPLLEGTDGVEKMSKSLDNYIALTDTPREMFGKVMSIPDTLITRYMRYAAFFPENQAVAVEKGLADGSVHPRNAKVETAMKIVELYHSKQAAEAAFEEFERIFKNKELPDEIEEVQIDSLEMGLMDLLVATGLAPSKKEAKRLIEQGGVLVDQNKVDDPFQKIELNNRRLLKVGKRKFLYVVAK
ncbi:MAG TPA: tyrosine--tRNA ligase [Candidatus Kapabacteria bacterium]|jgi:tyrosyl-tRNA synthetase|nr:tyrosine--tRNA ligase [Candidatus Kapabacteria bacterium]HPU24368.1 tyrosine--tRNA ligase [Candidatus Kapabacteria bacterium]